MIMKKGFIILLILLPIIVILCACRGGNGGDSEMNAEISGKTFVWEKPGFGGDFTITLQKNGKYEYYVGFLSSYIGMGTWNEENGIVTLTETSGYDNLFRFAVKEGGLSFIAEGSSKFMYVTVEDGDMFLPKDRQPANSSEETTAKSDSYTQISQEEAKEMMNKDDGHVIVDVRRQDEYDPNTERKHRDGKTRGAARSRSNHPDLLPQRQKKQGGGAEAVRYGLYSRIRIRRHNRLDGRYCERRNYGTRRKYLRTCDRSRRKALLREP